MMIHSMLWLSGLSVVGSVIEVWRPPVSTLSIDCTVTATRMHTRALGPAACSGSTLRVRVGYGLTRPQRPAFRRFRPFRMFPARGLLRNGSTVGGGHEGVPVVATALPALCVAPPQAPVGGSPNDLRCARVKVLPAPPVPPPPPPCSVSLAAYHAVYVSCVRAASCARGSLPPAARLPEDE